MGREARGREWGCVINYLVLFREVKLVWLGIISSQRETGIVLNYSGDSIVVCQYP